MTREWGVSADCPGTYALRRRFYRALAEGLVSSGHGAVALFESTLAKPIPHVTTRPAALLAPLVATSTFAASPVAPTPIRAADEPLDQSAEAYGLLVAARGPFSPPGPEVALAPPAPQPLVGTGGWLAFQTFWTAGEDGRVWAARRFRFAGPSREEVAARLPAVAATVAQEWSHATGRPAVARAGRFGGPSDWRRAATRAFPRDAWGAFTPGEVERTAEPAPFARVGSEPCLAGHGVVLGASGAGKTWFLADRAASAIARGESVVAIDLHGDLGPAIVARLSPEMRRRVVAVDALDRPVPGIAGLAGPDERAAAHLIAAIKRLTPDGSDVYWGFRLERVFDSFARLVQESGGTLLDLYALLADPDRRDAARLASRNAELVRFLEELTPIVRRTPDFLWPAAARLSKIVLVPALAELLAPPDGGIPVEELLDRGRSLLVRIPFAALGPEAASFAGTLVLARIYLGLAARNSARRTDRSVLAVLDEVQGLSPRLVAEMLAEGRKFGLRILLATQYPERLAPELRHAAGGVARDVLAFRVPPPSVAVVGSWLGLPPWDAARLLTDLPVGHAVRRDPETGALGALAPEGEGPVEDPSTWPSTVASSREEFSPAPRVRSVGLDDPATERLLLAVMAADESGRRLAASEVAAAAHELPGPSPDPATLGDRLPTLVRQGWLAIEENRARLTPAGERLLGLGAATGATRESAEHRALLLRAFRTFARRGYRIEIVRQGRYDTTLPDAVFRQIPESARSGSARELARALDSVRDGWAWRFFGGRDVHLEAEVSGADRPARIRHGYLKARARGAFALFLVADARRAARVRRTLRSNGVGPDRAQVWTLPPVAVPHRRGPGNL
jgi:hypothetical protein